MSEQLAHHLANGIPYHGFADMSEHPKLRELVAGVQVYGEHAHNALYNLHAIGAPYTIELDDPFSGEEKKYITFADKYGQPLYGQWNPDNPATDIGIRGIHPRFEGRTNHSTVIHADETTVEEFEDRGAPRAAVSAVEAVAQLNSFVVRRVVKPFLEQVAELDGLDRPEDYKQLFYPYNRRAVTLTRAIMYHAVKGFSYGTRPYGSDGKRLHIKEHVDQSAYTVDVHQTAPGLQYFADGEWQAASTDIAIFRGGGEDFRDADAPPALHRVEDQNTVFSRTPPASTKLTIARMAIVTFVSPTKEGARIVQPSSAETHPTEQAAALVS